MEPCADPLIELQKLAGQVIAWKQLLAEQVAQLAEWRYTAPGSGTEQLRAEVALFERAMDRCLHVLTAIAKLDLDNRLARITEQQAAAVVRAVSAAITAAGITGTAAAEARATAARHLRAVSQSNGSTAG